MTLTHSQADIESIKALLANGLSYAAVGCQLGMTKSAVSGLMHRLKNPPQKDKGSRRRTMPRPPPSRRTTPTASGMRDLPVETPANAVPLIELGDNGCHWPVAGEGVAALFCNADRGGSSHVSYCRHHAARSVRVVDEPGAVPVVRAKLMAAAW